MTDEERERLDAIWKEFIIPQSCRIKIVELITDIADRLEAMSREKFK